MLQDAQECVDTQRRNSLGATRCMCALRVTPWVPSVPLVRCGIGCCALEADRRRGRDSDGDVAAAAAAEVRG